MKETSSPGRTHFSGWRVLAALSFVFFANMGFSQFGGAVLNAGTVLGLHLNRRVLGYAVLVTAVVYGLSGPLTAWAIKRLGTRLTIVAGSLLMAVGMLCNATLVKEGWQFVTFSAVFIGLGIGLSTQIPAQACVNAWFIRRRALAISLVWTAAGVGGFVAPPLLNHLNLQYTWRAGWLFVAGLMLVSGLVGWLFLADSPAQSGQHPDGTLPGDALLTGGAGLSSVYRSQSSWTLRDAARTPTYWMLLFGALAQMDTIYIYLAHGVLHLMGIGHSRSSAALSVSVFAIGAVIGKLSAGLLGDRIEPRFIWASGGVPHGAGYLRTHSRDRTIRCLPFFDCFGRG